MKLQSDSIGFAKSLSQVIDENYNWKEGRGLEITKVTLAAIEYDEDSKALLSDVKKADALSGARGNSFMQQSVARGMQAAGENGGAAAMGFMGMGMNAAGGVMGAMQQPTQAAQPDPTAELAKYKSMLDQGLITQEDYDAAKKKLLGL
jgi:membrane protease subunit (stomatin/prohibitin family)